MSATTKDDFSFSGPKSDMRCEGFIRRVRKFALEVDRCNDDKWLATFAATRLDGEAARWFETLDEDTRRIWRLLRKAILARWSLYKWNTASTSPTATGTTRYSDAFESV